MLDNYDIRKTDYWCVLMKSLLSSPIVLMDKSVTNDKLKDIDPDLYIKI